MKSEKKVMQVPETMAEEGEQGKQGNKLVFEGCDGWVLVSSMTISVAQEVWGTKTG